MLSLFQPNVMPDRLPYDPSLLPLDTGEHGLNLADVNRRIGVFDVIAELPSHGIAAHLVRLAVSDFISFLKIHTGRVNLTPIALQCLIQRKEEPLNLLEDYLKDVKPVGVVP